MFVYQLLTLIGLIDLLSASHPIQVETFREKSVPDYTPHPETGVFLIGDIAVDLSRNAQPNSKLWSGGVIPYVIDKQYPKVVKDTIVAAMAELERDVNSPGTLDCIRFEQRIANEANYIRVIARGSGCYSSVGCLKSGPQEVSIGKGCESIPVIMHELVHTIGFHHEQERPDRDSYININWTNIQEDKKNNFLKHPDLRTLNAPYDYGSLMHYTPFACAVDPNKPVLTPKRPVPDGVKIGQQLHLSQLDVLKIQRLYNCTEDTSHVKQRTRPSVDHCDFGRGLCNFKQEPDDQFDWTLQSGPSDSGPDSGLTTGNDNYVIAKASGHYGHHARLVSKYYTDRKLCIEYSYFLHGPGSELRMYIEPPTAGRYVVKIHKTGDVREWRHERKTINNGEDVAYRLVFEALTRYNDVAIDDFYMYNC